MEEEAQAPPSREPAAKGMRMLKELKNLAPWQWDSRVGKHPPGAAALRDFSKVRREGMQLPFKKPDGCGVGFPRAHAGSGAPSGASCPPRTRTDRGVRLCAGVGAGRWERPEAASSGSAVSRGVGCVCDWVRPTKKTSAPATTGLFSPPPRWLFLVPTHHNPHLTRCYSSPMLPQIDSAFLNSEGHTMTRTAGAGEGSRVCVRAVGVCDARLAPVPAWGAACAWWRGPLKRGAGRGRPLLH